jgi:hypothetical protein
LVGDRAPLDLLDVVVLVGLRIFHRLGHVYLPSWARLSMCCSIVLPVLSN